MERGLTNCIALGVGVGKVEEAVAFYVKNFGGERHGQGGDWVEVRSGGLRIFIVGDATAAPTFDLAVENVDAAVAELIAAGCEKVDLGGAPEEQFVRDPYGHFFCISPRSENGD